MEQLQLEVQAQLCNQDEGCLVEMIENLGIEDDVAGKLKCRRLKLSGRKSTAKWKAIKARICLEQLFEYMKGTAPPLEPTGESTEEAEQKAGSTGVKSEKKSPEVEIKKEQVEKGVAERILSELEKTNHAKQKNGLLCH